MHNNTLVLGPGSSTVIGGVEVNAVSQDWNITAGTSILDNFSGVDATSAPSNAPPSYQGSIWNGTPVGMGNDTIFGGTGNSHYLLSNGNNWLDAGGGNDIIQAGTGNNTIFGGTGNDTILGGGGSNYINLESVLFGRSKREREAANDGDVTQCKRRAA